jgi:CRP/FNR family transcriptional regulator
VLTPFQNRALRSLGSNAFFAALGHDCMRWVSRTSVRKGEILFEKNEPSEHLHGLVSGQLKLYSSGDSGQQVSLELVAPGEVLGVLGVAGGTPRHASAVALANSELATIRRRDLEPLMDRHPALRTALSREAADAAARFTRRLEDAAFLAIEDRIEKTLFDLAARFGEKVESGTKIHLRQQDIADLLGLSRESVSRVLTSPSMHGRLQLGRGNIVLVGI